MGHEQELEFDVTWYADTVCCGLVFKQKVSLPTWVPTRVLVADSISDGHNKTINTSIISPTRYSPSSLSPSKVLRYSALIGYTSSLSNHNIVGEGIKVTFIYAIVY